jgi:glycosyltransferase involved in cell wall biosynthesis
MADVRVSIIVPAYNEVDSVREFAERACAMLDSSGFAGEILFVDDGSTDGTGAALAKLSKANAFVRVATHRRNFGLTAALQTGFSNARGDVFVFYPADLQFDPEEIPTLVNPILDGGADMVCGRKRGKYGKRFVSWVYNHLVRLLFGVTATDMNSVKAFRRQTVDRLVLRPGWHRYLVVLAADRGYRVVECEVTLRDRRHGVSKFRGGGRVYQGFLDLVSVWFQLKFLRKPLIMFGTLGIITFGSGMIVAAVALYYRFVLGAGFRPLLYLVMLLVILGGLLFMMGFLLEAVVSVREEVELLATRLGDKRDE